MEDCACSPTQDCSIGSSPPHELPSREKRRTIPLYVFVPEVAFPDPKAAHAVPNPHVFPVVTDYHGGGFYLGSCLEQAPFCAKLCRELQAVVISVDYRSKCSNRLTALGSIRKSMQSVFETDTKSSTLSFSGTTR